MNETKYIVRLVETDKFVKMVSSGDFVFTTVTQKYVSAYEATQYDNKEMAQGRAVQLAENGLAYEVVTLEITYTLKD